MSYIKEYAKKLVTAEEAVKVINSNDWVDYGWSHWMQLLQQELRNWKMLRSMVVF